MNASPVRPRARDRRAARYLARTALGLLTLLVGALPFAAAYEYHAHRAAAVSVQAVPPPPAAAGAALALRPAGQAPVVLAYHDVNDTHDGPYTVTPKRFDRQLGALRAAGYHALSTAEFDGYLRGARVPPRSVYLTFDDAAHGLWVHADRILRRHHMRGAAYLITHQVGRSPYYLSWAEVRRMAGSGRWDFQSHTGDLHHKAAVDGRGHLGPALANRTWLPDKGRLESPAEYRARVAADLDGSIADLRRHGLPRPTLFAYPFSESGERGNLPARSAALPQLLASRFTAALTNTPVRALPPRRRSGARLVQRLEVRRTTSPSDLLTAVTARSLLPPALSVPPDRAQPLRDTAGWRFTRDSGPATTGAFTGAGPYPAGRHYLSAGYRPVRSAEWDGYTVEATVSRLSPAHSGASLRARDGSAHPLTVTLGLASVSVIDGGRRTEHRLRVAATHRLRITVRGSRSEIAVDGRRLTVLRGKWPATEGGGGVSLAVRDEAAHTPWPRFDHLVVSRIHTPDRKARAPHRARLLIARSSLAPHRGTTTDRTAPAA